jgi:hypothetical protein
VISAKSGIQSTKQSAETHYQSGSLSTEKYNPGTSTQQRILSSAQAADTLADQQFAKPQRFSSVAGGEL